MLTFVFSFFCSMLTILVLVCVVLIAGFNYAGLVRVENQFIYRYIYIYAYKLNIFCSITVCPVPM